MAAISSLSTIDEIKAAYIDNADYAEVESVAKAKTFVTVCRILLMRLPKLISKAGQQIAMNPDLIRHEMIAAQAYIDRNDEPSTGTAGVSAAVASVRHPSFTNFRR